MAIQFGDFERSPESHEPRRTDAPVRSEPRAAEAATPLRCALPLES